ncbi:hypothetical protein Lal_00036245 [Lupinus albus]|nr:hypothetical protein Lal_00036245 [Lupinus albus]
MVTTNKQQGSSHSQQHAQQTVKTIYEGFMGGNTTRSVHKRHLRQIMHLADRLGNQSLASRRKAPPISFVDRDYVEVIRGHSDPSVVMARLNNKKVGRVLVDQGGSADNMFQGLFNEMDLGSTDLLPP